ncbi:MAG: hypothetical protein FWE74_05390 [Oscillospiraceae bacterium]|nr:hypothetical protein [Oscillospiraceae bacterium]
MTFRDAYKEEMNLVRPGEAVIDSILREMRKEVQTPTPSLIRRIPTSRLAAAVAGICILAAAVVIPVVLRGAPSFNNEIAGAAPLADNMMVITESEGFGGFAEMEEEMYFDDADGGARLSAEANRFDFDMEAADESTDDYAPMGGDLTNAAFDISPSSDMLPAPEVGDVISAEPAESRPFPVASVLSGFKFDLSELMTIINKSETISDVVNAVYEIYPGPYIFVETPTPSTALRIDDTGELVVLVSVLREAVFLYDTAAATLEILFNAAVTEPEDDPDDYSLGNARISQRAWVMHADGGTSAVLENWHHGETIYHQPGPDMQGYSVSGIPLRPQDAFRAIAPTMIRGDFRIEFTEPPTADVNYALYDSDFNQLSSGLMSDFTAPTQAGLYMLVLDTSWTMENEEGVFWSAYQFFILLEIP